MEKETMTKERQILIESALEHCIVGDCTDCPLLNMDEDASECKPLLLNLLADYIDFLKKN